MAAPYLVPCLSALRAEANDLWPGRDKRSDGWIGDAAHASRSSDHNPDPATGAVRAWDLDRDGVDMDAVLARAQWDPRLRYIIWNRRIWYRSTGIWAPYRGANPHTEHAHFSAMRGALWENDRRPWGLAVTRVSSTTTLPTGPRIDPGTGALPAELEPQDMPLTAEDLTKIRAAVRAELPGILTLPTLGGESLGGNIGSLRPEVASIPGSVLLALKPHLDGIQRDVRGADASEVARDAEQAARWDTLTRHLGAVVEGAVARAVSNAPSLPAEDGAAIVTEVTEAVRRVLADTKFTVAVAPGE